MEQAISGKTVTYTALIVQPPKEIWEPIQKIRQNNDPAYDRWMPHINLSFPFIPPDEFDKGAEILQEILKDFHSFDITFENFNSFDSKKCVLYLQPETDQLQPLYQCVLKAFPFLKNEKKNDYVPHLTCGNKIDQKLIQNKKAFFQKDWKSMKFNCSEIYMISRNGKDDPFHIDKAIKLKTD